MSAWIRVAELTKAKHLKGGLVARSVAGLPFLLEEGMHVFFVPPQIDVAREGTVVEIREEAKGNVVFFDTVTCGDDSEALVGCYCMVLRDDLPDDVLELADGGIEGYSVVDGELGFIGTAVSINEMPGQNLLEVSREGSSNVLIPVVEEFIAGIDEDDRTVYVAVPSGLLDL